MSRRFFVPLGCACALSVVAGVAAAASRSLDTDEDYAPAKGILEIVATLRRHIPDDTYRFEPARDISGRNVYRVSLTRLENMERLHNEALRAGHMDEVIAFAKARALERLRAFDLSAEGYRRTARFGGNLEAAARRGEAMCQGLAEAAGLGYEQEVGQRAPVGADDELGLGEQPHLLGDRQVARVHGLKSLRFEFLCNVVLVQQVAAVYTVAANE